MGWNAILGLGVLPAMVGGGDGEPRPSMAFLNPLFPSREKGMQKK
jgi:hypothetical protein